MTTDVTRARELAAQFRSHPASRSIDEIEEGGELLYTLAAELERAREDADAFIWLGEHCEVSAQVQVGGWRLYDNSFFGGLEALRSLVSRLRLFYDSNSPKPVDAAIAKEEGR